MRMWVFLINIFNMVFFSVHVRKIQTKYEKGVKVKIYCLWLKSGISICKSNNHEQQWKEHGRKCGEIDGRIIN